MRPSNSSLNLISNSKPNLNANSASGAAGASAGSVPAAAAPSVEVVVKFDETHFVLVKGGTFTLGSDHYKWANLLQPWEKLDRNDILPNEPVNDFVMSKYLVTFGEYDVFCNDTNRPLPNDQGWGRGRRPVVNVTWLEATRYCNWRSVREGFPEAYSEDGKLLQDPALMKDSSRAKTTVSTNKRLRSEDIWPVLGYRLPSDVEWEFAAKGGVKAGEFQFVGSNDVDEVAWYKDNTNYGSKDVGLKKANELGLYDMAGNVYEYCSDGKMQIRVLRGGGWSSRKESMRPSYKNGCRLDEAHSYVGFRICRSTGSKFTPPTEPAPRKL